MTPETAKLIARREALVDRVRSLLVVEVGVARQPFELDADAPLFGSGIALDSVDGIELSVAIENAFGLTLPEGDEITTVLRSINTIVDFVIRTEDGHG